MGGIAELNLDSHIGDAAQQVFDKMLSMDATPQNGQETEGISGERVVGTVGLTGDVSGIVCMVLGSIMARSLTARMLDMEEDEIEDNEDVNDVIGELCNMIGGNLKSRFCDSGLNCILTIPTITRGSNFKMTCLKGAQKHKLLFRSDGKPWEVQVYIKEQAVSA